MAATTEPQRNARRIEKRLELAGRRETPTEEAIRNEALTDFIEQLQSQVIFWKGITFATLTSTALVGIAFTFTRHLGL
jgi:hypothetical protein